MAKRRQADTMERQLLKVPEVAEVLGVGKSKAYELVARREIPGVVTLPGGSLRVSRKAIEAWIEERIQPTSAAS